MRLVRHRRGGPRTSQDGEPQDGEGKRQVGGENVEAEDVVVDCREPVVHGRLFKVADAVDVGGDPVAGDGHVGGGLGVSGVDIVHLRRPEESGEVDGEEDDGEDGPGFGGGAIERWRLACIRGR